MTASPLWQWWGEWHCPIAAIQWDAGRLLQVGVHVEWRWWLRTNSGVHYGPYIDFHLPLLCVSIGRNPIYSGEWELLKSYSRGGFRG